MMKISSAKAKGRRLQNFVVDELRELYSLDCSEPDRYSGDIQAQPMGQSGVDVKLSPLAKTLFKFDVECKAHEKWSVHSWIKQAESNTEQGRFPLVVMKRNRDVPYVILSWNSFKELIKK